MSVLTLTERDTWPEKVVGLRAGADDYLAKPFELEEMLARVEALIRLLFAVAGPVADIEDNVRAFTAQVAITLTVLGIGLLLVVWLQVRFGLRPLQAMQQALGDLRKGKAQRTIP